MSTARVLYNPLKHVWLRAKEPLTNNNIAKQSYRFLEMGMTERGLEDIGDITSVQPSVTTMSTKTNNKNTKNYNSTAAAAVQRGDELLQIHFDGHCITSADELYHTVWETYSDHVSIQSPVSGIIGDTETDIDAIFKSAELDGIDEETVLMEITTTKDEWKHACQQNYFVDEVEYLKIIEKVPRGPFY